MSKYVICPECEGEGNIRGGAYAVTCHTCEGLRVVTQQDIEQGKAWAADRYMAAMEDGDWESANYWRSRR